MKKIFAILTAISMFAQMGITAMANTTAIYVSPDGTSSGTGTASDPVNSLETAKTLAKTKGASEIIFEEGTYKLNSTVNFDSADTGTYRANGEVIFSGAEELASEDFTRVNDPEILMLLPQNARTKVLQYDLSENGIEYSISDAVRPYLYVDDVMQTTARYPNSDFLIAETADGSSSFTYTGYDVSKWENAEDAVAVGRFPTTYYWRNWDMSVNGNTISVTDNNDTTTEVVRENAEFYVENLIEELDTAGEYFVDRKTNMLYYYPAGDISDKKIEITAFFGDAVNMTNAENITFDGITFDKIGGRAFDITGANNVRIQNCIIKNIQGDKAVFLRGANSVISDNLFYSCAGNVIEFHGGDVRTLTPGNIEVKNNKISLCGFREKNTVIKSGNAATLPTYDYMNKINNNLIQDCMTFMGIECNAYDYKIMKNEILNQGYLIGDGGAIYMGRSTVKYGTEVAYNYIHDGHKEDGDYSYCGLYSDDAYAGANFHHNVIKDMFHGFITGVGMDTKINNNLLINNSNVAGVGSRLTTYTPNDGIKEHKFVTELKKQAVEMKENDDYTKEFWDKYSNISKALDRSDVDGYPYLAPWNIEITGNVAIGGKGVESKAWHLYYEDKSAPPVVTGEAKYKADTNFELIETGRYIGSPATYVNGWYVDEIAVYGADIEADGKDLNGTTDGNPILAYNEDYFTDADNQNYTLTDAFSSNVSTVNQIDMSVIGIQNTTNSAINTSAASVELTAPANNAVNVDTKAAFAWNRVNDASKYRIVISTNSNLSSPVVDETFNDTTNALIKEYNLNAGTEYYWQVTAIGIAKNNSFTVSSNINKFTTKTAGYLNKESAEYAVELLENELAEYEAGRVSYRDETIVAQMTAAKNDAEGVISSASSQAELDSAEAAVLALLADAKNSAYTEDDVYTVAFLGGSLTAGGSQWIADTKEVLETKMPGKVIETINAGKGGTGSNYGAARFAEDIAPYAPDMVFIDFAVNDTGASEKDSKVYMESIVRQCKELEKEPVVIFLYTPYPVEKNHETYTKWLNGVNWKEEIAEHYGIKSINIYDYMQEDCKNSNYASFTEYLAAAGYKDNGNGGFDVHAGYGKYGEAIVKAFNDDYASCISPMKNVGVYCRSDREIVNAEYNQIPVDSNRLTYTGSWQTYTGSNVFSTDDSNIKFGEHLYAYPYFTNGIKQIVNETAEIKFTTSADKIYLNHVSALAGSAAKVYIDGEDSGKTITCYSSNSGMNYMSNGVILPGDGEEHTVELKVEAPTAENYVFRFGSIVEYFEGGAKITQCAVDQKSDDVTVTVEGFDADEEVSVMVTNPNYDKTAAESAFNLSTVQYTNILRANEQGVLSFVFNTRVNNDDRSGNYTLYIGTADGGIIEKTYNYGIISVGDVTYKDGETVITDLSEYAGKTVTMYCPIENNTGKDIKPAVVTAIYADGKLVNAYINGDNSIEKAAKKDAVWTVALPSDFTGVTDAKVMFLESMQTLKPLSTVRVIYEVK